MKSLVLSTFLIFISYLSYSQCPVVSPNPAIGTEDGPASMGCGANEYFFQDYDETVASGTCWEYTGSNDCDMVFYGNTYDITCDFCVTFSIQLNSATVSDGVAFNMVDFSQTSNGNPCQNIPSCAPGGNIGYNGLNNTFLSGGGALTVEFDIFQNTDDLFPVDGTVDDDDPACDHISLIEDGDNVSSLDQACVAGLGDNTSKDVEVCWDAVNDVFTVDIDGTNYITYNSDISTLFTGTDLYFGFSTGYNASFFGQNNICDWDVIPLPTTTGINLINFSTQSDDDNVVLNWSTSEEEGNKEFTIERSYYGKEYVVLGKIEGNNNSNRIKKYAYTDESPLNGYNYYRIKQLDYDGDVEYFDTRVVNFDKYKNVKIFNSGKDINISGVKSEYAFVNLYDLNGKLIANYNITDITSQFKHDLKNGLYIVQIISNTINYSTKISILND